MDLWLWVLFSAVFVTVACIEFRHLHERVWVWGLFGFGILGNWFFVLGFCGCFASLSNFGFWVL